MKTDRCKKPGEFRFASLGDVHLGHSSTPTRLTLQSLARYVTDDLLMQLDMLIIEGDLFDHLLHAEDDNLYLAHRWMSFLLMRCAAHNVMLEVVEGTPFHDRHQSRYFVEQKHNANIPVELHYATELSIRYIERLDAHFLYVPDKCRPHTDDIWQDVQVLLKEKGLKQVDFAIMHGAFGYQLPDVVTEPTHSEANYLGIVKHYILIGHVHVQTINQRILAAGSFDRHSHGDEIPKGFYNVTVRDSGQDSIVFIENRHAKRYDTIECHGMDTKALNVAVRKKVAELPKGSSIKLRCNPHDAATGDINFYRQEFPQFEWAPVHVEKAAKSKDSVAKKLATLDLSEYIPIDPHSLVKLLEPELLKHSKGQAATAERCARFMEELLEA